jgi:hypothetical protein
MQQRNILFICGHPQINRVRTGGDRTLHDHAGMDRGLSGDVRVDTVFIRIETVIVRVTCDREKIVLTLVLEIKDA